MLDLHTTEEFAEWFSALDDTTAEEVATALEVVERLGPTEAAPGSSEWLLWYSHSAAASPFFPELEAFLQFRGYATELVEHLRHNRFVSALRRRGPDDARRIAAALERIHSVSSSRRWVLQMGQHASNPADSPRQESACSPRESHPSAAWAEARRGYLEALAAAGLDPADIPAHSAALRELLLETPGRRMRLLYGVDTERGRALVILGEMLDRNFYGDSVRRAELVWKRYLQEGVPDTARAQLHRS